MIFNKLWRSGLQACLWKVTNIKVVFINAIFVLVTFVVSWEILLISGPNSLDQTFVGTNIFQDLNFFGSKYHLDTNIFGTNFFLGQKFFKDPNLFVLQIFMDLKCLRTQDIWSQHFFIRPKNCLDQKFFERKYSGQFLLHPIFFGPEIFLWWYIFTPKIYLPNKFFDSYFLDPNFFTPIPPPPQLPIFRTSY